MELDLAHWLVSAEAVPALVAADAEADPGSLGAAQRLRRDFSGDQAAAALTQVRLRRRAVSKFGARAGNLFFTTDGLEQATRAEVATWRAERFASAGAATVVDLGCGLGADALALLDAGMAVVAVEFDPVTAVFARANLGVPVMCADAVQVAEELLADGAAVFLDPARRTASRRTWRVADFSPPWDFAAGLMEGRIGCVKGAPGLPASLVPEHVAATWVSHRGDLVETSLWSGVGEVGSRTAVLLPSGVELNADEHSSPAVGKIGAYFYEPDPAVIRAGALGALAVELNAWPVTPGIAYLSSDRVVATPLATAFEVLDVLHFDERVLRAWVRDNQIGTLEIKSRGIEIDPALLRRRLKPKGARSATVILTPAPDGARALIVRRMR